MKLEARCCCGAQFSAESDERLTGSDWRKYRIEVQYDGWQKAHRKCLTIYREREARDPDELY